MAEKQGSALRGVGRKTRLAGSALAVAGAVFLVIGKDAANPAPWRLAAIVTLTAGWGLLIFGMMRRRTQHLLANLPRETDSPD
jgi:hypothetical protein